MSIVYVGVEEIKKALRETLLTFLDKSLIVNPGFFYKIYEGKGFSISHRFVSVASDASADVYFGNPSGSGRTAYIVAVEVVSLAQAWVDIYRGVTVSTPGSSITPVNLNLSSENTSVAKVEHGGEYSGGELVHSTVCLGGSHIRAIGGATEVGESVVIPEDNNFLVKVTNKSASSTDLSIRIIWWEE